MEVGVNVFVKSGEEGLCMYVSVIGQVIRIEI